MISYKDLATIDLRQDCCDDNFLFHNRSSSSRHVTPLGLCSQHLYNDCHKA